MLNCRSPPYGKLQAGKAHLFHPVKQSSVNPREKGAQSPNPVFPVYVLEEPGLRENYQESCLCPRALLRAVHAPCRGVPSCSCKLPVSQVPLIQLHNRARALVLSPKLHHPLFPQCCKLLLLQSFQPRK